MNSNMTLHHLPVGFRRVLASCLIATCASLSTEAQTALEYFWNEDPGVGCGTSTRSGSPDGDGYYGFGLNTSSLVPGINVLGYRALVGSRWSHTQYSILVMPVDTEHSLQAEYFWNEDPGLGKGTPLSLGSQINGLMSFDLDASQLLPGYNLLGVRAWTCGGWSQTQTYIVNVAREPEALVTHAEYFWDEDPGIGKGIAIESGTGLTDVTVLADGLEAGRHTLGLRACTAGVWGQTLTAVVDVPCDPIELTTYAEYFWDDDPGQGNGTPIVLNTDKTVEIDNLSIDFPTEEHDVYVLSIRARTQYGWGPTYVREIPHLYVESIEIETDTAKIIVGESLQLKAILTPVDAFVDAVEWRSSNTSVATVDDNGTLTGLAPGEVTITVSSTDGKGATATYDVEVVAESSIESIFVNADIKADVYNISGILVLRDADINDVRKLSRGIYIVRVGSRSYKLCIRN